MSSDSEESRGAIDEGDSTDAPLPATGLAVGLIFGAAAGSILGVVVADAAPTLTYGAGGGLLVGTLVGRLIEANLGEERLRVRVVGGSAVVGLFVGAVVGAVAAWSIDAGVAVGASVGAGVGLFHGALVGAALLSSLDDLTDGSES